MKVNKSSLYSSGVVSVNTLEILKENLEKLAARHNTTVDELIESARNAGINALPYQVRALNIMRRIERLEE